MNLPTWSYVWLGLFLLSCVAASARPQASAKGKEVFEANCAVCHSADSEQPIVGPGLKDLFRPAHKLSDGTEHKEHTVELIRKQIVDGGDAMAPLGDSLTEQEFSDLVSYLQTL